MVFTKKTLFGRMASFPSCDQAELVFPLRGRGMDTSVFWPKSQYRKRIMHEHAITCMN